jgi:hypothetical protein
LLVVNATIGETGRTAAGAWTGGVQRRDATASREGSSGALRRQEATDAMSGVEALVGGLRAWLATEGLLEQTVIAVTMVGGEQGPGMGGVTEEALRFRAAETTPILRLPNAGRSGRGVVGGPPGTDLWATVLALADLGDAPDP